ncbi:unnamed protein product, partial [Owenia fusiformis]
MADPKEEPRALVSSLLRELKDFKPYIEEHIRKIDGTFTLLLMKTDMVKSRIQLTHQQLLHQLNRVQQEIIQDLGKVKGEREKSLATYKVILNQHLDQIKKASMQAERLLELGHEDQLQEDCQLISLKLGELMKMPKVPAFDALTVLDFVPS